VTIESRERILSPALASAIEQVIQEKGFRAQRILTYLANGIQLAGKVVPYSVVVGIDSLTKAPFGPLRTDPADILPGSGQAIVNRWTADRLGARVGSTIDLEYFAVRSDSSLEEKKAAFRVSAIAEMEGRAIDRSYTPEFPGITDADTFADWNAPFPVDLDRVQEEDEKYWKDYRTAPKVFVPLKDAQKLWGTRFGRLTSVRLASVDAQPLALDDLDRHLRSVLDPKKMGFWLEEIKARDLKASAGSTDFGTLFLSMSFFLIVSAAILVGLLFRLNTERRASSIGIMLATGSPVGLVRKALLAEGVVLAASGTVLGLAGSILYARWLIRLLSTWWRDAVGTSFVEYHASPMSFALGAGISMVVALLAIVWATRRLRDVPVPQLLTAGFTFAAPARSRWARWGGLLALGSLGSGLVLIGFGGLGWLTPVGAFFGGGTLVLMGLLAGWWARWTNPVLQDPAALVRGSGGLALGRLGVRNASRYPSRSLLTATLLALAVFLVVSVGTMRHGRPADRPDLRSGNGGFALMARSTHPLPRSLADPDGRFALNVSDQAEKILADSQTFALRVRPGDDASCLNVYQPKDPTILGVPSSLMARGGFAFASMLSPSEEERQNPWLMLERNEGADVVPVMGDAATLQWILKVPLGGEVATTTEDGREVRLRVVGTLSESVFQGQLLLSEENFKRLFPSLTGTRFFLIAPPAGQEDLLATKLEADLEDFGFDVDTTARVIQGYLAVQETYMAAFQTLGGLGLLLGTLGLGIVVLRNVLERRGELALLRAVGFSGPAIGGVVLAETATLLLGGMGIGTVSACLAVLPTLGQLREVEVLLPLGGMLLLILLVGLASSWFAVRAALANPIISSLRSER
jgi:ABC-type antimicrobial peptide transport system permease subunit